MVYLQGTVLRPKNDFSFKVASKGRTITFCAKDAFWVANSMADQFHRGAVEVCRKGGSMGSGYRFAADQVDAYFVREA